MISKECWPDFIPNVNLQFARSHVWQIQIKAEGNTSISKFFLRKGAGDEDSKPEQKIPCHEFVKTEQTEDLSEGGKIEEGDKDLKSSSYSHSPNDTKFPIKRDYDALSADSKPALGNNDQVSANPAKKKEKARIADDKQPTLFSYFGKR